MLKKAKNRKASKSRMARRVRMPIGISDFAEVVRGCYAFVDKTSLIGEIIERGSKLTLITRPRRFGKTLNLSMLQYFFSAQVQGQPTRDLFDGLAISKRRAIMARQGQHPVIFLTFKGIKGA